MDVDGNTAPVVAHRDAAVAVQGQFDPGGVSGLDLVHRVVDDLERHMMQAGTVIGVTDIHTWAATNRVESFQDGDRRGIVGIAIFGRGIGGCSGVV